MASKRLIDRCANCFHQEHSHAASGPCEAVQVEYGRILKCICPQWDQAVSIEPQPRIPVAERYQFARFPAS